MSFRTTLNLLLVISLTAALGSPQSGSSKCVNLDQVMQYLALYQKSPNSYPQSIAIGKIKQLGFCERPTDADMGKIKAARGSQELIAAIEEATSHADPPAKSGTVPTPAVPPSRPKEGRLSVVCEPVDCENISVNGKVLGHSTNGEYTATLAVGLITVVAARENYEVEPRVSNTEIKENATTPVTFKLTVSPAALQAAGTRLFARMVEALGGESGLKALSTFKGAGILSCYDRTGQVMEWDFSGVIKSPDKARFEVNRIRDKTKYEAANTAQGLEWSKLDKAPQFSELDFSLRRVQEQHVARRVGELRSGGYKMTTPDLMPKPGEDAIVLAEGGGKVYRIRIGADMRPREILLQSGGLDSGQKVQYSEYEDRGGYVFPKVIEIYYPDAPKHGVKVQLRSVEVNSKGLTDADFTLKKKGKLLGIL
jgi:hypothetical protein